MKLFIALSALILAASALPAEVPEDYDLGLEMDVGQEMDIPQEWDEPQELEIQQELKTPQELDIPQEFDIPQELGMPQEFDIPQKLDIAQEYDIPQELDIAQEYDILQDLDSSKALDSGIPVEIGTVDAATFNGSARNVPLGQVGFATANGGTHGGQGGAVWTVWDAWALRDAVTGNDPRIVYVRGRIDLTPLFNGSPGIFLRVGSAKSIIGGDNNAMIFGGGLSIVNNNQVIIQNIKFHNALSYAPGEQPNGNGGITNMTPGEYSEIDAIDVTNSVNIWIDHCEFADDPWNAASLPASQRRHDGLIDIKRGANWITVSNNIFRNHNHNMLVGHNDNNVAQDYGKLKVTYYLNWFQGVNQRNPRVRFGEVHVLNNLYTDIGLYGIGAGAASSIYGERNVFVNTARAWGFPAGTPNPMGNFFNDNNLLMNSQHDSGIPNNVSWRPSNYYQYTPINVNMVEAHVRNHAGVW